MKMEKFNDLVARSDIPTAFNSANQNSIFESSRNIKQLEGTSNSVHQEIVSDDEEDSK